MRKMAGRGLWVPADKHKALMSDGCSAHHIHVVRYEITGGDNAIVIYRNTHILIIPSLQWTV